MVRQSTSRSVGHEEPKADCLIDSVESDESSVDLELTSIEHSEVEDLLRVIDDNIRKTGEERSRVIVNSSSSHDTSESEYSKESDLDLSIMYADSDEGFESVLQMGCMDTLFLPPNAKPEPRNSLYKFNKKGKKELNINVKGPLALGFEAKMKDEAEKTNLKSAKSFGSILQDTMSCGGNRGGRNGIILDEKLQYYEDRLARDESRDPEFETFRSLMSLSHGSSEDEDCDNSVIPKNFGLPPPPQQFPNQRQPPHVQANLMHHQQQYQGSGQQHYQAQDHHPPYYHMNQQQQMHSYGLNMSGIAPNSSSQSLSGIQNNQPFPKKLHGVALLSPLSTSSMPNQILVGQQSPFEEGSFMGFDAKVANAAPDPPSKSLPKIVEDDYLESSSEEESNSSMVACGSVLSETQENPSFDAPKKITPKKGGKLSKVDRWKRANIQRLRKKQHLIKTTPPILEEKGEEEYSIGSDQATYSSANESKNGTTPKESQSLAFDSIFSQRIEKRRAAKQKKNAPDENKPDVKSPETSSDKSQIDSDEVWKNPAAASELASNVNMVNGSDSGSSDGIPVPPTETIDHTSSELYDSSAIEAVAAAAALALNQDYKPKKEPSFDKEDTENREPPAPLFTGKKSAAARTKTIEEKEPTSGIAKSNIDPPSKNPFQDNNDFDLNDESYEDEVDVYPLQTQSNSDHEDILRPFLQTSSNKKNLLSPLHAARMPSSPLACRNRTIPMTPSPRLSSRPIASPRQPIASPRHFDKWNNSMHSLSKRMAASKLERCPSGEVKRTESIKCFDSVDTSEFFEANMYA